VTKKDMGCGALPPSLPPFLFPSSLEGVACLTQQDLLMSYGPWIRTTLLGKPSLPHSLPPSFPPSLPPSRLLTHSLFFFSKLTSSPPSLPLSPPSLHP